MTKLYHCYIPVSYTHLFDKLTLNNYYKTDTHWKQEDLFNVANTIANQMNFDITNNNVENTITTFKGSYAGRLSVTKDIDTIKTISNPSIDNSLSLIHISCHSV